MPNDWWSQLWERPSERQEREDRAARLRQEAADARRREEEQLAREREYLVTSYALLGTHYVPTFSHRLDSRAQYEQQQAWVDAYEQRLRYMSLIPRSVFVSSGPEFVLPKVKKIKRNLPNWF